MDIRNKEGKKKWSWTENETKSLLDFGKFFLAIVFFSIIAICYNKEVALVMIIIKGLVNKI